MRCATSDISYSHTSARNPVTFTAEPGEVFQVRTLPNCGRRFDTHTGQWDPQAPRETNASAGNIAIAGASAGANIVVHVLGMELDEFGYTRLHWPSVLLPQLAGQAGWESLTREVRMT